VGQADLVDGTRLLSERFVIGIPSQSHSLGAAGIADAASIIFAVYYSHAMLRKYQQQSAKAAE
jgi:hypothetical protein